ncbi:hypothetical protein D4R78_06235 [bacterium]|nr:MAG: hypothetical protein D4R78_06235 [bacterium]
MLKKFLRLNKREKAIFYIAAGFAIFYFLFTMFIGPLISENRKLNQAININRAKLKKYLGLLNQKDQISKRYEKLAGSPPLPSQSDDALVVFLTELEKTAKEANIKIIDIRPEGTPKIIHSYKEFRVNLKSEGSTEEYLRFIYSIENVLPLARVEEFQFNAKSNTPLLEGNFSISQISLRD